MDIASSTKESSMRKRTTCARLRHFAAKSSAESLKRSPPLIICEAVGLGARENPESAHGHGRAEGAPGFPTESLVSKN